MLSQRGFDAFENVTKAKGVFLLAKIIFWEEEMKLSQAERVQFGFLSWSAGGQAL